MFTNCQNSVEPSIEPNAISLPKKDKANDNSNNNQKEIDWASVAIADGGGAALGADLAKYSANIYVVLASAIGVGAYASMVEYERQKEAIQDVDIAVYYKNPLAINPYHPINKDIPNKDYLLFEEEFCQIGLGHNEAIYKANEEQKTNELDSLKLFKYAITQGENYASCQIDEDLQELYNKYQAIQKCDTFHNKLLDYYCTKFPYLDKSELEIFTHTLLLEAKNNSDQVAISGISTTFFSYLLWNTIAPNPNLAKEGIAWNTESKLAEYIVEHDNIKELSTQKGNLILYPSYASTEAKALFVYCSKEVVDSLSHQIEIQNEISLNSQYTPQVKISLPNGIYEIKETKYDGIYYILL